MVLKKVLGIAVCLMVSGSVAADEFGNTYGDGVAAYSLQKFDRARQIWQVHADQGHVEAQFRLAGLYALGKGGPVDMDRARDLYTQAANAGHVMAMVELTGMAGDAGAAGDTISLNRQAAEAGYSKAAYFMGDIYMRGQGVDTDHALSFAWFRCAATGKGTENQLTRARQMVAQMEQVLPDRIKAASYDLTVCG